MVGHEPLKLSIMVRVHAPEPTLTFERGALKMEERMSDRRFYAIGDVVPQNGQYLCAPCGFIREFVQGGTFTTCEVCYAGTEKGWEGYTDPKVEFWEFLG